MSNWKKYGGIYNLENNNNISVYSLVADIFTLRQSYYGTFDICGELHVSGNAIIDSNITTNNLTINNNTYAQRLFVYNTTNHYNDVDISGNLTIHNGNAKILENLTVFGHVFLGTSEKAFIYGSETVGNVGINTLTPIAAFDISSSQPLALNVGSSSLEQVYSIPVKNSGNKGIRLSANTTASQVGFFNDNVIDSSANGTITYTNGGVLTLDVSNNTNVLSQLSVSNRQNGVTSHVVCETAVIYDISSGSYLPAIYQNSSETTGNALSLIANDSSSNTFMNIITPNKQGLSIGGGVYPNDQSRPMGTMGWRDNNAIYTPTLNMIAGNSHIRYKTTIGINTNSPEIDSYALDINGPIRVKNGELTITKQANIEIRYLAVCKTDTKSAVSIGSPYTIGSSDLYRQTLIYTNNGGETWNENYDFSGQSIENQRNKDSQRIPININTAYVYDSSLTFLGGDYGYLYYTYKGYTADPSGIIKFISIPYNTINPENNKIKTIYVTPSSPKRVFLGIDISGENSVIYSFDMPNNPNSALNSISLSPLTLQLSTYSGILSMDGYGNLILVAVGKKILSVTSNSFNLIKTNTIGDYNSIYVLDQNNVIAAGNNIISFSTNGGVNWTDISSNIPIINRICLFDSSNAIAVCNAGVIIYTQNWKNINSWKIMSNSELNVSGNANRLTDSGYNLTHIGFTDTRNFYITKLIQPYNATTYGNTSLFHVYLPNLFNNTTNYVLDMSGSARLSGDINVNDGGKIASNNQSFNLLNNTVNQIQFGGDASNVFIGSLQNSTVTVNSNLTVLKDSSLSGNLGVTGNATVYSNLNVTGNVFFKSELNVTGNAGIKSNLIVTGNATVYSNLNVTGNVFFNSDLNVTGNVFFNSDLNVTGNVGINSNMIVTGNASVYSDLNVTGNVIFNSNLNVKFDSIFDSNIIVKNKFRTGVIEGIYGELEYGPIVSEPSSDIYIGGYNITDVSNRMIKIGNFNPITNTSNHIYIGGPSDEVIIQGSTSQTDSIKVGPIVYINSGSLTASYAGIHIGDSTGNLNSGYFVVSNDRTSYLLKAPDASNSLRLDLSGLVIPDTQVTGLVSLYQNSTNDGNVTISTSLIDPSNIILGNTTYSQQIYSNLLLRKQLDVTGNATVYSNLNVTGNVFFKSELNVTGNAGINSNLIVTGNATVYSNLNVTGNVFFKSELNVTGNAGINSNLIVTGNATVYSNLNVTGNVFFKSELNVTGNAGINSNLIVTGNATVYSNLNVTGNVFFKSELNVTGNAGINSNLIVTGNTIIYSNLYVDDYVVINGAVTTSNYALDVNGSIQAISYNARSDRRLKSNIHFLSNQSKSILKISPVTFNWKVDGKRDIGFIAQNVYDTYPELLSGLFSDPSLNREEPTDSCGNPMYYAIDYGRMTPFLWQGMREILQRIDTIEEENRVLKFRVDALEQK